MSDDETATGINAQIIARGTGCEDEDYLLIKYRSSDEYHKLIVANRDLTKRSTLNQIGIIDIFEQRAFETASKRALEGMRSTLVIADRSGWCNNAGHSFVFPEGRILGEQVEICLRSEYRRVDQMRYWGTLTSFQQASNLARGNSCLMLAIAHALTGPVAHFLDIEAPAILFVSANDTIKAALLSTIASMWGGSIRRWSHNKTTLEKLSLSHHGTHLILDNYRVNEKLSYADLHAITIRMLDGRTKARLGENSTPFCLPVTSTSDFTLNQHAQLSGLQNKWDMMRLGGRLFDIPLSNEETTLFEDLHRCGSPHDLIENLETFAEENPGCAALGFIDRFRALRCEDDEALRRQLTDARHFYETNARDRFDVSSSRNLNHVHANFATIYAAGLLAIGLRVVRWSTKSFLDAIMTCEEAHIAANSNDSRIDLEGLQLAALRKHIDISWRSFVDLREGLLNEEEHNHDACPGYINRRKDGTLELLFAFDELSRICGGRAAVDMLRVKLRSEEIVFERKSRPSVVRFIYRGKNRDARVNVMALKAEAFQPFKSLCATPAS